jgi:hypothetical protein
VTRLTDHARFTEGDCHILAYAIVAATGWDFCTFEYEGGGGAPEYHAFVGMPDGRYLDINGVSTYDEMFQTWMLGSAYGIRVWKDGELEESEWAAEAMSCWPSSNKRAAQVARKLLWHSKDEQPQQPG